MLHYDSRWVMKNMAKEMILLMSVTYLLICGGSRKRNDAMREIVIIICGQILLLICGQIVACWTNVTYMWTNMVTSCYTFYSLSASQPNIVAIECWQKSQRK